jgi:DNA-directed RNA polymerase specialized sigma24 family protein
LLVVIATRKAIGQRRRQTAQKRGGGKVTTFTDLQGAPTDINSGADVLAEVVARGPSPEIATMMVEESRRLLAVLNDDISRRIAILKMEGFSQREIAQQVGRTANTVRLRLRYI